MPKSPKALTTLPPAASRALRTLGENLTIARKRRRESQRVWAKRIGCSVPTLIRMEHGDPGVGMGIYATALWLMGRAGALPDLAAPKEDHGALENAVRESLRRYERGAMPTTLQVMDPGASARQGGAAGTAPATTREPVGQAPQGGRVRQRIKPVDTAED